MNGEWIEVPAPNPRMRLWDEDETARLAQRRRRKAGPDGAAERARR